MKENIDLQFKIEKIKTKYYSYILRIIFKSNQFRENVILKKLYPAWNNLDLTILRTNAEKKGIDESLIKNKNVFVEIHQKEKKIRTKFDLMKKRLVRSDYDPRDYSTIFRPENQKLPKKSF